MTGLEWIPFYEGCAKSLLAFSGNRHGLYGKARALAATTPLMDYLHLEHGNFWGARDFEIDPFTIMAIFNRGITTAHRSTLARMAARMLAVNLMPPREFHGIAHLDSRKSIFSGNQEMWDLFIVALDTGPDDARFIAAFDRAMAVKGNGLGLITIGLFWAQPDKFMAIDRQSISYIDSKYGMESPTRDCDGKMYAAFLQQLRDRIGGISHCFATVALASWNAARGNDHAA